MKRVLPLEPIVRSALWSRRCGLLGVCSALGAVAASQAGWLRPPEALGLLGIALLLALAAILLAGTAAVVIWRTGWPGIAALLAGLSLAALLLAGPAFIGVRAALLPALNDVSTDLVDPPRFAEGAAALAAREGLAHPVPDAATRQAQVSAYPDVQPALLDGPPASAFAAALKLVKARRWRVLASHPPGPGAPGTIDAVARTAIMAFRDDVTIRVAPAPDDRSRVDMRSASRVGWRDLGANAARIAAFLAELEGAVEAP